MNQVPPGKRIINFPSDKNGCGFYRSHIPFGYMTVRLDWDCTFLYQFIFDLNIVRLSSWVRFQRQCTENQIRCIHEYRRCIDRTKSSARISYELDDLVHGIEPHNVLAYQFYTPTRRQNVVEIMKMSHRVTFTTQFLKDFYAHNFGIHHSVVIPNYLPKFMWGGDFIDKKPYKKKPVVLFAGSASHIGQGGDLEFLLPMIEATTDEFEWLFVGVCPPRLQGKVSFMPWVNFYDYPSMMQKVKADIAIAPIGDTVFNLAKSDLKFLEYSAMNIPSLFSTIGQGHGPYDGKPTELVSNTADNWYQAIKELSKNENKQQEILKKQQEFVNTRWLELDQNIQVYDQAFS